MLFKKEGTSNHSGITNISVLLAFLEAEVDNDDDDDEDEDEPSLRKPVQKSKIDERIEQM